MNQPSKLMMIGMDRPTWDELLIAFGARAGVMDTYVVAQKCRCGESLGTHHKRNDLNFGHEFWVELPKLMQHWQQGHFDNPVYARAETSAASDQRIIEYKTVYDDCLSDLDSSVMLAIKEGWQPLGGSSCMTWGAGANDEGNYTAFEYRQTMVKYGR